MPSVVARFAESVKTKNPALHADLIADGVRLYGVPWSPFEGKETVLAVFRMLQEVTDDLEYVAEYEGPDGVVLQVRGTVDGRSFDGMQLLRFDSAGLIDEIRDLIRPHSAGTALLEVSAAWLARQAEPPPGA